MDGLQWVGALVDGGSTIGLLVVVILVTLRRPAAVATIDESVRWWMDRQQQANDAAERRELARERNDAEHRAWDGSLLLIVATSSDLTELRARVTALGPPPRLTPDPSEWLDIEQRRARHRAAETAAKGVPVPRR